MLDREVAAGRDPLLAIPGAAGRLFYAWDDDGGEGYSSALSYTVRQSGDYQLFVLGSPATETSGSYRLLVGIDSPAVLSGSAVSTGDKIAYLNRSVSGAGTSVQEIQGTVPAGEESVLYWVNPVLEGDVLYAYLDTGEGDTPAYLFLRDYGEKPVAIGVPPPGSMVSTLSYSFPEAGSGYTLHVDRSRTGDTGSELPFRLLVGLNEPAVVSGTADPRGEPIVEKALTVYIGMQLDQITDVNQKEENFAVVATIWMTWNDRELAFSPDSCNCSYKLYRSVSDFTDAEGPHFPEFTITNQQERRWTQNELVLVNPDGTVTYYERFWSRLQAPDFDFRRYPFDQQDFYIRVDSLYPESYVVYSLWDEKTAVGEQLGEEEWVIDESDTNISTVEILDRSSRYSFHFNAIRNLTYYIFRIFIPISIIIILTYIPFLLADYGRRADIASANLLLLVLFSFTVTSDLPHLGYTTFLDIIIVLTFIISGFTVAYNLYLKWLATEKGVHLAKRIDRIMLWFYPVSYIILIVYLIFIL